MAAAAMQYELAGKAAEMGAMCPKLLTIMKGHKALRHM
jgi:hypothetical protein